MEKMRCKSDENDPLALQGKSLHLAIQNQTEREMMMSKLISVSLLVWFALAMPSCKEESASLAPIEPLSETISLMNQNGEERRTFKLGETFKVSYVLKNATGKT